MGMNRRDFVRTAAAAAAAAAGAPRLIAQGMQPGAVVNATVRDGFGFSAAFGQARDLHRMPPEIQVPPFPQTLNLSAVARLYKSGLYRVEVKAAGDGDKKYRQVFVFETRNDWVVRDYFNSDPQKRQDVIIPASQYGNGKADIHTASFANFSFVNQAVQVRVTLLEPGARIDRAQIRPLRLAIAAEIAPDRRSMTFTLDQPRKVSVEINGRLDPLFIFSDRPDVPDETATYYFGPGIHRIPGDGTLLLKSGERVYIAAGAIVEGRFRLERGSSHITIRGRGLLSGGEWPDLRVDPSWQAKHAAIYTEGSNHFLLEGLTLVQSTTWQVAIDDDSPHGNMTHDNVYRNINTVSWNGCTDGIWITGNHNRVENVFIFNNDDAFVTKGGKDTLVTDAVVWGGTWGRFFLFFNTFGNTPPVENLTIENVDVIGKEAAPAMILFQNWGVPKPVKPTHNVIFRNIVFEERRRPGNTNNTGKDSAASLVVLNTNDVPGAVSDLTFENITLDQLMQSEGELIGTPASQISKITFENIHAAGRLITNLDALHIRTNAYVSGLKLFTGGRRR